MAFLIVEEEYEPAKHTQTSNNNQASTPASSNQYKPQTPSAECQPEHFPLLNLPLELRDRVYYYYLYQPNGFRLKRSRAITRSDRWRTPKELSVMPLFLTSKQIYQEALRIFCRYNVIEVTTRGTRKGWSLPGSLRLFPDKHARLMQRVSRSYDTSTRLLGYPGFIPRSRETHPVGKQWVDMIHEARCLKDYFPMLREFTVRWNVHPDAFRERDGLLFNDKKKEQKVVVWLKWMRFWAKACNVRPVPWMRFEFHTLYYNSQNPMAMHEDELNEAYQILCEELRVPECGVVRIEESGRTWLEEAWNEGAAARRKRKKEQDLINSNL